ncbi:TPA: DUF551 domain-containing protein [Klebsiella pneumoniae]
MDGFDGDRRGIADCLCDAEEALIEVVNRRAAMFNHPEQHLDMVDHSGDVNEKGGDGNSPVIPDGSASMLRRWLAFGRGMQNVGSQLPHNLIAETESMLAAAPQSPSSEPATVPGKWIPVSERMPDREVDVQVYCPDKKEQMVAYLERNELEGYFRFATWRTGDGIYCQPTHWMRLPAGPREVKGE